MTLRWIVDYLESSIEKRGNQQICERCGLVYDKDVSICPHCVGINDNELANLLDKRKEARVTLGKGMMIGAIAIILLPILAMLL